MRLTGLHLQLKSIARQQNTKLAVSEGVYQTNECFARECCPLRLEQAGQLSFQEALTTSIGGTPVGKFAIECCMGFCNYYYFYKHTSQ